GNIPNIARDLKPFSQTVFEASPLNRVLEQGAPGTAWQPLNQSGNSLGKTVKMIQRTNALPGENIRLWTYNFASQSASSIGFYGYDAVTFEGQMMVMESTDEQGLKMREYKDKEGQVVCKKVQKTLGDENSFISTYYVYDDFGNLRFVLPPEAVKLVPATGTFTVVYDDPEIPVPFTKNWLFTYKYDERQRMVEKQVPGTGITYMVYDRADRLVLSQDARQRLLKQWTFTKYDALSRVVVTGLHNPGVVITRESMQASVNNQATALFETRSSVNYATNFGYTRQVFPTTNLEILSVSYYDDYNFDFDNSGIPDLAYQIPAGGTNISFGAKGKPTSTYVKVLNEIKYLRTTTFYDKYSRVIQIQADNYKGTDVSNMFYDFAGKMLRSTFVQNVTINNGQTPVNIITTIKNTNKYDHAGRVLETSMNINNGNEQPLAVFTYNELGQMVSKNVGTNLQKIDYTFNIRGWLKKINDAALTESSDVFGMELFYNDNTNTALNQFNGNISGQSWKSRTDEVTRGYNYTYDGLNRLTSGTYQSTNAGENFTMNNLSYDDNGNIKTLSRYNLQSRADNTAPTFGKVDDLLYGYTGNRLQTVQDAVTAITHLSADFKKKESYTATSEYTYDANGSLTQDRNKGIQSIEYNHLNLPATIMFDAMGNRKIENVYDASGVKVAKKVYNGSSPVTTYYIGGMVYEEAALQFIPTAEGRALPQSTGGFAYEYHYKDHLGNLRVAFREGNTTTYTATMEATQAGNEDLQWANVTLTRNGAKARTGTMSSKLTSNNRLGPWRTVKVGKGDQISFTAASHYSTAPNNNIGETLRAFLATAAVSVVSNAGTESGNNAARLQAGINFSPLLTSLPSNQIKAYIQIIVLDKDYKYISSSKQVVSTASLGGWEELTLNYKATTDGYVEVMVVNESNVDVWFDDISVTKKEGLIAQETAYDPFGLELKGIEKIGQPEHDWKYNGGTERNEDLDLNWDETPFRSYDYQLGRFHQVDMLAGIFVSINPYHFGYNNPIKFNDPTGLAPGTGSTPAPPEIEKIWNFTSELQGWMREKQAEFEKFMNQPVESQKMWTGGFNPTTNQWEKIVMNGVEYEPLSNNEIVAKYGGNKELAGYKWELIVYSIGFPDLIANTGTPPWTVPAGSKPDGYGHTTVQNLSMPLGFIKGHTFKYSRIFEFKNKSQAFTLTKQMKNYLSYLGSYPDPAAKREGVLSLFLIGPSTSGIHNELVSAADAVGVNLLQSVAYIHRPTQQIYFTSPIGRNNTPIAAVYTALHNASLSPFLPGSTMFPR
ncbi:MAG: hypothetical protein H7Y04_06135, partial [Verrucomicrobia bacterium]|nr:hypothetical protein [Cytophagales bacterium]